MLVRVAVALGHGDVGSAVEDVLAVDGALAECCPALGVVVIHVIRVDRRGGDVELQSSEVREHFGDPRGAIAIDC